MAHPGRRVWDLALIIGDRNGPVAFVGFLQGDGAPRARRYGRGMATPPPALPGAAPTALRPLLAGAAAQGRVRAVLGACVYAELDGRLVAVEATGGLRLPCAVLLGVPPAAGPFGGVRVGDPVTALDGTLTLGPLRVRTARWWRPASPRDARPPSPGHHGDARRQDGWDALARSMLGLGPGLTPAGDDLLAGLLVGLAGRPDLRGPLAAAVARHAPARTTWLSGELLRLAADGLAAPAVVAVADALAGHGPDDALATSLPGLLAVGHTSGAALARGLLLAATTSTRHPVPLPEAA